ncbi:MAG TPA: ChbG/HpnK family deacetylase, partial [Hyphomicrobiales bacterium]|nr:ChbG/HpnK family deacetylase [Hyphomicrobiales bacterium]
MGALIINADDYAMDAGVDAAILALGKQGRVTAASAMVLSPRWADAALALKDSELSVGLHIDFTSPFADRFFTRRQLPALIIAAHARFLDSRFFEDEIDRQFDLFERGLHRPPGFIDGHQHVHHLPILRDALFRVLKNRYGSGAELIGLRVCAARRWRGLKAAIIGATGAFALARLAAVSGNPINSDFAGVYDFGGGELSVLWERWLDGLRGPLPLIMCHVAVECG